MAIKTKFGLQVDAWGALAMERADLAQKVEKLTTDAVKERGLEGLTISRESVALGGAFEEAQEYVVFEQDLGGGGRAATLLRVAPRGKDLDISWRLFEKNVATGILWGMSQGTLLSVGALLSIVGVGSGLLTGGVGCVLACPGVIMIGAGMGWWMVGRKKTTASTTQQFDSRALANTVHWALMKALASNAISNQHVQVLRRTSEEDLGKLMPTDVLDEIIKTPKVDIGG